MPHYNQYSMPALSLHTGAHLVQLINERRFRLYDRGSRRANRAAYGVARPPDLAAQYHLLAGLPVDMVAGRQDGIVAAADVHTHYTMLRDAGVRVRLRKYGRGRRGIEADTQPLGGEVGGRWPRVGRQAACSTPLRTLTPTPSHRRRPSRSLTWATWTLCLR